MTISPSYTNIEPARSEVDALALGEPVVVEFGTAWCGYCQASQPAITTALSAYPDLHHLKIEDGPGRALGRSFRVKLWPTLIFMRDGKEVSRLVRPTDAREIHEALSAISPAG